MDRMVIAGGYGICLFSADTLQDFLKREKIRKRKLLSLLQKDKELYLNTQREGIFIPLVGIDHYNYAIKLEGQDEPFDDQWVQKISYEGFNLEVKDGLWISAIEQLEPFEPKEYHIKEEEFYTTPGYFGSVEHYHSPWERWYKSETPDGICTIYTDIKYNVPAGKYLLSIKGYTRKEQQKFPTPNCGFFFSFTEVDSFEGFKNPRESDEDDCNLGSIK